MPSVNGNGRNGNGTFKLGNAGGPGNPWAKLTHKLKTAIIEAAEAPWEPTGKACVQELSKQLIEMALTDPDPEDKTQAAKRWAMQEVLTRILGKPKETLELQGEDPTTMLRASLIAIAKSPAIRKQVRDAAFPDSGSG